MTDGIAEMTNLHMSSLKSTPVFQLCHLTPLQSTIHLALSHVWLVLLYDLEAWENAGFE